MNAGQVKNPVVCAQSLGYDSSGKVCDLDAIRFRLTRFSGKAGSIGKIRLSLNFLPADSAAKRGGARIGDASSVNAIVDEP